MSLAGAARRRRVFLFGLVVIRTWCESRRLAILWRRRKLVKPLRVDVLVVDHANRLEQRAAGQRASIDDLKEGDDVRASFDPQTNKIIRLDIQSGKEMKEHEQKEQKEQGRPLNE
jgi:hypothetical protein